MLTPQRGQSRLMNHIPWASLFTLDLNEQTGFSSEVSGLVSEMSVVTRGLSRTCSHLRPIARSFSSAPSQLQPRTSSKCEELFSLEHKYGAPIYQPLPVILERGEGTYHTLSALLAFNGTRKTKERVRFKCLED
ncbi:hypothetical protein WMY93_027216 [Mugilogobius chulae]|uniref:Uncharacterized protein n=1 Tax=Mugilogobius chulae TaxID=88201 RepID=A0AAW0MSA7_9GOBI